MNLGRKSIIGLSSSIAGAVYCSYHYTAHAQHNRIYFPELEPLLILKGPLLANFTVRNDPRSNGLTGAIHRIVEFDADKPISLVDVEADEPEIRPYLLQYGVNEIPTIVALKSGIPLDSFVLSKEEQHPLSEEEWTRLKNWVDKVSS